MQRDSRMSNAEECEGRTRCNQNELVAAVRYLFIPTMWLLQSIVPAAPELLRLV